MTPSDVREVPLADLAEFPGNPRRGDVPAIAASLSANGQFQPLIVQSSTGHVLSGNHTLAAMRSLGWDTAVARFIDADDAQARRIVLAANRTFDLGAYDDTALLALLSTVDPADLSGTGYDLAFLDSLAGPPEVEPYGDDEIETMKTGAGFTHDAQRTQADRRLIVLDMPSAMYAWVVQGLAVVRERRELPSNIDAIGYLLAQHVDGLREAPAVLA